MVGSQQSFGEGPVSRVTRCIGKQRGDEYQLRDPRFGTIGLEFKQRPGSVGNGVTRQLWASR